MTSLVGSLYPFVGGGVTGVAGFWIYLFLTGQLFAKKSLQIVQDDATKRDGDKSQEIERLRHELTDERNYSKQLVREMQEQNEVLKGGVMPTLAGLSQQLLLLQAQSIEKGRNV